MVYYINTNIKTKVALEKVFITKLKKNAAYIKEREACTNEGTHEEFRVNITDIMNQIK